MAISGTTVIAGAMEDEDVAYLAGSAHVFERDGSGAWVEVAKLTHRSQSFTVRKG